MRFNNSLYFVQLFEFLRSETLKVKSSFHFFVQTHTAETIFFCFEMTYRSINFFVYYFNKLYINKLYICTLRLNKMKINIKQMDSQFSVFLIGKCIFDTSRYEV